MSFKKIFFLWTCVFLSFQLVISQSESGKHPAQLDTLQQPTENKGSTRKDLREGVYDLGTFNKDNSTNVTDTVSGTTENPINNVDFSKPGVMRRAFIVFGGFMLLGVAYFTCYRWRHKKAADDASDPDGNQFRYGVLHSDDRSDRMELSHLPLTLESEDDDEEDLEIFDLGRKKEYVHVSSEEQRDVVEDIVSRSRNPEPLIQISDKHDERFGI